MILPVVAAIVIASMQVPFVAGNQDPIRCITGTYSEVGGVSVFDHEFESLCRVDQPSCVTYEYVLEYEYGGTVYTVTSRYSECAASIDEANCTNIIPTVEKLGNVLHCVAHACNNHTAPDVACNRRTNYQPFLGCTANTNPLDLQVFPNCTFQQLVTGTVECLSEILTHHPYKDSDECSAKWDEAVECLFRLVPTCLLSNCPSIFDDIPGVRSEFSSLSLTAEKLSSVSRVDALLVQLTGSSWALGDQILCPAGTPDADAVNALLAVLGNASTALDLDGLLAGSPVDLNCPELLSRVTEAGFQFIREFLLAERNEQVSAAVSTFLQSVESIVGACGLENSVAGNLFSNLLTFFFNNVNEIFPTPATTPSCPSSHGDLDAWREDYRSWRRSFDEYKRALGGSTGGNC